MRVRLFFLSLIFCFALTGCSFTEMTGSSEPPSGPAAPAASQFMYYNFPDVRVPTEMKPDETQMFVHGIGQNKTGVLVFSGRVDFMSLTKAMITTMTQDGWELKFQFNSPRTLLLFTKPTRFAIVNITNGQFNTDLEIWVSPRPEQSDTLIEKPLPLIEAPASKAPASSQGLAEQGLTS